MSLSYRPEPNEQAYYLGLFQAADVQKTGNIGGAQAVQFFTRSKLSIDVLKNIWTVADQPQTSSLNLPKFSVAIRLIQLTQNGQKGQGPNLAAPPEMQLRPVFFEGVSGVSVQMPGPPPQQQQQMRAPPSPGGHSIQQQQQMRAPPSPDGRSIQQQQMRAPPSPGGRSIQQPQQAPYAQQQQQQPPPTPFRPPVPQQQGQQPAPPTQGGQSFALTAQDPYSMPPQERSRYESLFPQYAREDGFVYGAEAVALFSKSGLNPGILRDLWNLVDTPVDNRLDKLEFAMAMHLIVCISKKNLPVPSNGLPMSLKQLKQQEGQQKQQQQMSAPSSPGSISVQQQQQQMGAPPQQQQMSGMLPPQQQQMGGMPPPQQQQMGGMPQPQQQQMGGIPPSFPSPEQASRQGMESFGNAPGIQQSSSYEPRSPGLPSAVPTSGVSISDAFEGLSTTSAHDDTPLPSYVNGPSAAQQMPNLPEEDPVQAPKSLPSPAPQAYAPHPEPRSSSELVAEYDMGDTNGELGKLKGVLQKLQAENISLKAQLGSMTEEEKDVLKEVGATISEIGKLSDELTTLRAQVLAAKSKLLEASAELKAAKEKKSYMTDLISEAAETKSAIEGAHETILSAHDAVHTHAVAQHQTKQAVQQSNVFESNLFGFDGGAADTTSVVYNNTRTNSFDNFSHDGLSYDGSQHPPATPAPAPHIPPTVEEQQSPPAIVQTRSLPPPPVQTQQPYEIPQVAADPREVPRQQLAPQEAPAPASKRGQHHTRVSSVGEFNAGYVMGGAASPLPSDGGGLSPPALSQSMSSNYGYDEDTMQHVEKLGKKVKAAQETANNADLDHRKLAAEADELRADADRAEATARSLRAATDEKKKGVFGGGGKKKKTMREAERAAEDAAAIRKRFMQVQGHANNAQAVAMETKRELEKLRSEAEQAELDAAQAASIQEQQSKQEAEARRAGEEAKGAQQANGYSQSHPFGGQYGMPQQQQPPPPQQQYGQYGQEQQPFEVYGQNQEQASMPPAPMPPAYASSNNSSYGYGQMGVDMYGGGLQNNSSSELGFAAGVMGQGGGDKFDLPSPQTFNDGQQQQDADPYSNPF